MIGITSGEVYTIVAALTIFWISVEVYRCNERLNKSNEKFDELLRCLKEAIESKQSTDVSDYIIRIRVDNKRKDFQRDIWRILNYIKRETNLIEVGLPMNIKRGY